LAAKSNLKAVTLELGGKSPFIYSVRGCWCWQGCGTCTFCFVL
jgi:hypothetical protein